MECPLKIAPDISLDSLADKAIKPEFRRNEAAVDSELVWLPLVKMKVPLEGPLVNVLYSCTNRAMLSPLNNGLLLVSRLDGPTPEIANALVDKALAAETNGLWGRVYFDLRNLPTNDIYYAGDAWLQTGAQICHELGFDVQMDNNAETFPASFPMSQIAIYAGWYDANVSGPLHAAKSRVHAGRVCLSHLHSYSASTLPQPSDSFLVRTVAGQRRDVHHGLCV